MRRLEVAEVRRVAELKDGVGRVADEGADGVGRVAVDEQRIARVGLAANAWEAPSRPESTAPPLRFRELAVRVLGSQALVFSRRTRPCPLGSLAPHGGEADGEQPIECDKALGPLRTFSSTFSP